MKELKIKIGNVENIVFMQVVEQDDSLRGEGAIYYSEKLDFKIFSENYPMAGANYIYVQGKESDKDDRWDRTILPNEQKAIELVKLIKEVVEEYNDSIIEKKWHRFIPKKDEGFYFFEGCYVDCTTNLDWEADKSKISQGNSYKTLKEAERKKEIFDKLYELKHDFTMEDWENDMVEKHSLFCDFITRKLIVSSCFQICSTPFCFKTKEKAQEFVNFCGFNDYCKYVLGIYYKGE